MLSLEEGIFSSAASKPSKLTLRPKGRTRIKLNVLLKPSMLSQATPSIFYVGNSNQESKTIILHVTIHILPFIVCPYSVRLASKLLTTHLFPPPQNEVLFLTGNLVTPGESVLHPTSLSLMGVRSFTPTKHFLSHRKLSQGLRFLVNQTLSILLK